VPYPALSNVLRHLRGAAATSAGVPDAELLERFATAGDSSAFELLLWRHGPMVLGVCRRLLRHEHDAEDAFQATFLALAKKAGTVARRDSVGGWLYRVASRVALAAGQRAASRAARERLAGHLDPAGKAADPGAEAAGRELWRALDEELGRLSERCRSAFVLCCLEGRSGPEAARELGCAVKALESRLVRARARLRVGLTRRGLLPSAGAALLLAGRASAGIGLPPRLVALVLGAAGRRAAGAAVSANVLSLTEGVLRAMFVSKLKLVGAVVLAAGMIGAGAGGLGYRSWADEGTGDGTPAQARPEPRPSAGGGQGVPGLNVANASNPPGPGDELRQLKALMDQQRFLAAQLEALARRLQDREARGREQPAPRSQPAGTPVPTGGTAVVLPPATTEQQRRLQAFEAAAKALRTLTDALPPDSPDCRSALELEVNLKSLRDRVQKAGLLGPVAGRPAAVPEVGRGSVRDVTPGGLLVLAIQGDVRPGQWLRAYQVSGNRTEAVGEVVVVLVDGGEAIARVASGRPQRGNLVRAAHVALGLEGNHEPARSPPARR
jgi:RNA polymerase sigma factor (sigma-70 family)